MEGIDINIDGVKTSLLTDGLFVAVGLVPSNEFLSRHMSLDEKGYIITDEMLKTNCDGVYASGDTRQKSLRQIVTAMSDGATASEGIIRYLSGE